MKKLILGSAILAVLGMSANAMAAPNTGTVNFTGAVSTATCDVALKGNAGGSISEVNLGTLANTATGNGTLVSFKLVPQDQTCLAKTSANVSWSSSTLNSVGFANAVTTGGTNAYMIMAAANASQRGSAASVKQGQTSFDYAVTSGGIPSFDYNVQLVKPTGTLTAGPFSASASYVVVYK